MLDKNRTHGKVDSLPEDVRREVENKLLRGETYASVADYLNENGFEIHFTSVGRFGKNFLKKFEAVRMAKEFAQLLAEDNAIRPATELHEANNMLVSQSIMEALADPEADSEVKIKSARAIAQLQQAQVQNERLKLINRKEAGAVKVAMNALREKVFETIGSKHPDIAKAIIEIAETVEEDSRA